MLRHCHPLNHWLGAHYTSWGCLLFHCAHQSYWLSSFFRYQRPWSAPYCCRWRACYHHKMPLSKYSHWYDWSHKPLPPMRSIPTTHTRKSLRPQQFDCYRTSRGGWGRNRPVGWERPAACTAFGSLFFVFYPSLFWWYFFGITFLALACCCLHPSQNSWFYDCYRVMIGYSSPVALHILICCFEFEAVGSQLGKQKSILR